MDIKNGGKDAKKASFKRKEELESAAFVQNPAMLGGRDHSSVGRKFLAALLKMQKGGEFDVIDWEDRQGYV